MSNNRKLLLQQYQNQQQQKSTLEEKINSYLLKSQSVRLPDGKIHPSMIGQCPRYVYFFMKKEPYSNYVPHSAQLQKIFDTGNDFETTLKKRLKAINVLVDVDKPIPINSDRVSGVCDAVVYYDGKYFVLDAKTANDQQFTYHIPHKKYKYQIAAYMYYLNIPNGKLYYSDKNNQKEVEVDMEITDPIVKETLDLIKMYNYNYDNNIIPDVSDIRPKCNATSCYYFSQCMKYSESQTTE